VSPTTVTDPLVRIVAAARECFLQFGIHRTRMEDVAERAGMSRQHLYRLVASRTELLELALVARSDEIVAELDKATPSDPSDVAEALVDYLDRVIKLGRNDPEFIALADAVPRIRVNALLAGADSPVHAMASRSLAPLLTSARAKGLLRPDVDDDSIVTWIQGVVTLLTPQDHLGPAAQEQLIRNFVLPSVLRVDVHGGDA